MRPGEILQSYVRRPWATVLLLPISSRSSGIERAAEMVRRLAKILGDPGYATYVAELRVSVVGVVGIRIGLYYEHQGAYAQVVVLSVDGGSHGLGVGRALLGKAEAWARRHGANAVLVYSGRQRTEAHAFYEHMGYSATGLRFVKELQCRPTRS